MPTDCFYIDPGDQNFADRVDNLRPTPGYCIFMDITGSTEMKQAGLRKWITLIHNCFANTNLFLSPFAPLKGIGDELMFYIEDIDLQGYNALQLYDDLWQIATETDAVIFKDVKIVAARCEQAYAITFIRGNRDYYGIDIDRTAHLKSKAAARQVVIDSQFHAHVMDWFKTTGNKNDFKSVLRLRGPERDNFKGIPHEVAFFRAE
jgi:hypothetical protein